MIIDPVVVHHDQARVQAQANEDERDNLEHPHDPQHLRGLLPEWQEFGHPL